MKNASSLIPSIQLNIYKKFKLNDILCFVNQLSQPYMRSNLLCLSCLGENIMILFKINIIFMYVIL